MGKSNIRTRGGVNTRAGGPRRIVSPHEAFADTQQDPMELLLQEQFSAIHEQIALIQGKMNLIVAQAQAVFDFLKETGVLDGKTPRGFTHEELHREHIALSQTIPQLLGALEQGQLDMEDMIEQVRMFNNEEDRIYPIYGHQFGLPQYVYERITEENKDEMTKLMEEFQVPEEIQDQVLAKLNFDEQYSQEGAE